MNNTDIETKLREFCRYLSELYLDLYDQQVTAETEIEINGYESLLELVEEIEGKFVLTFGPTYEHN